MDAYKFIRKAQIIIFAVLGAFALIAAVFGATHQYVIAGVCAFVTLIMYDDDKKINQNQSKPIN